MLAEQIEQPFSATTMKGIAKAVKYVQDDSNASNGVFAFVWKDGTAKGERGACHAGVLGRSFQCERDKQGRIAAVLTRINRKDSAYSGGQASEAACKTWYDYLFNRSLYAPWIVTSDVNQAWEDRYCIINAEMPANLLQSFCIATRNPWEFPEKVEAFHQFVSRGVQEDLAFVIAYHASIDRQSTNTVSHIVPQGNHQVFDSHMTLEGAKAWIEHKPLKASEPYNNGQGRVRDVNAAFQGEGARVSDCIVKAAGSLGKKEAKSTNPFAKAKPKPSSVKTQYNIDEMCQALIDNPNLIFEV